MANHSLGQRPRIQVTNVNRTLEAFANFPTELANAFSVNNSFADRVPGALPQAGIRQRLQRNFMIEEASNMSPAPAAELWLRNTRPFNAYGLPTISLPTGFTRAGLPIGLQIAGPRFGEGRVLAFAHAFEQSTDWHKRMPTFTAAGVKWDRLVGVRRQLSCGNH